MRALETTGDTGEQTDTDELGHFVTFRLNRVSAKLGNQAKRYLMQVAGVSLSQYRVIVMVGTLGRTSFTEIIRRTSLDRSTTSRTISGLIDDGLIEASGDDQDQRAQRLQLTERGRALYERIWPRMQTRQRFLLSKLDPAELAALHSALDKLEDAAEAKDFDG